MNPNNKKTLLSWLITLLLLTLTTLTLAQTPTPQMPMRGKHAELGLSCAACHGTNTPERKPPQSACRNCHGDKTQDTLITFQDAGEREVTVNPHASHVGDVRCTVCHQAHQPSKLYCNNDCHHTFNLQVP